MALASTVPLYPSTPAQAGPLHHIIITVQNPGGYRAPRAFSFSHYSLYLPRWGALLFPPARSIGARQTPQRGLCALRIPRPGPRACPLLRSRESEEWNDHWMADQRTLNRRRPPGALGVYGCAEERRAERTDWRGGEDGMRRGAKPHCRESEKDGGFPQILFFPFLSLFQRGGGGGGREEGTLSGPRLALKHRPYG